MGYYILSFLWFVISLLPLRLLYLLGDILYYPLYYIVKYRRRVVRRNLTDSFPEKTQKEIVEIEKEFYRRFCELAMETLKLRTMSRKNLKKRMRFEGLEELEKTARAQGCEQIFVYTGHYCNWEWVASLPMWTDICCSQIYHPLYNKAFDRAFLDLRSRFGSESIPMKESLRTILRNRGDGKIHLVGFISDQAPKWSSTHHWTDFLNHKTSFFIGTEKIGKRVGALICYFDMERLRRGCYVAHIKVLRRADRSIPDYELTDEYARLMETTIKRDPASWLWTHNRWKRTYEEWLSRKDR